MLRLRLLFGITIFWLALSLLNDGITALVLPTRLLGRVPAAQQSTVLGLLTFVGLIVGMLIQPWAGLVSDRTRLRWGRGGVLTIGVLLIGVSLIIFSLSQSLGLIMIAYGLLQISVSVAQAAQQGFLPDLVTPEQRGLASGLKGLMDLGGAFLGFGVLGVLLGRGQFNLAMLVIAIVVGLAWLLTLGLVREPQAANGPLTPRVQLFEALRLDWQQVQHRAFAWSVGARFLFLLGTYAVGRFFLFFVANRLHLKAAQASEQAGGLLAGLTLVSALSAPITGWAADRWGRLPLMLVGATLSASGVLLLSLAENSLMLLLFGGLMSIGSAAFVSANWALTADLTPPNEAARFFGLANFGTAGAVAAAGLFGPLVDGVNGWQPGGGYVALFVASALTFVASAVAVVYALHVRAQPSNPRVTLAPELVHPKPTS